MPAISELPLIVAFTQTVLAAIAGITHAYTYQPVMLRSGDIPAVMQVGGAIDYWTVTPESTIEAWSTNEEVTLTHDLVLRGYKQVREPNVDEPAFHALTSLVAYTFRQRYDVDTSATALLLGPLQLPVRGQHRMLADTFLVYYTEGHLRATERVTLA